ncbi:MAG: hypothetical protein H7A41_08400 [Chlamydiales bacterium]|nr:hypothetical protein [Chlamydiales bacterium]
MGFEEKVIKSQKLAKKIEFITIQSSEQRDEEVRYKNINRKQIRFDLSDLEVMTALGELLRPYGLKQFIENKMAQSKIDIFRLYGEKQLAKRAMNFLKALYIKHPEKFASVDLSKATSPRMKMIRGTFVISEVANQKTISLKDDGEAYQSELESFRKKYREEEAKLRMQEDAIKELTCEDEQEHLIGMDA